MSRHPKGFLPTALPKPFKFLFVSSRSLCRSNRNSIPTLHLRWASREKCSVKLYRFLPTSIPTILDSNVASTTQNLRRKSTSFTPRDVSHKSVPQKTTYNHQTQDTLIPASVLWIGPSATSPNGELSKMYQLLRQEYRSYFDEFKTISDYIHSEKFKSHTDTFIIVTTPESVKHLSSIHHIRHVRKIYLCFPMSGEKIVDDPKITVVSTGASQLSDAIRIDINGYLPENVVLPFAVFETGRSQKSTRNLDEETAAFISFQYLIAILCRLPKSDQKRAKEDLVEECKQNYKEDHRALTEIDEFSTGYQSKDALSWYTRESFIYIVLNKTLRQTQDSLRIFDFRLLIKDMMEQIQALHKPEKMEVYRGQMMSIKELDSLRSRIGALISINSFLSTSKMRAVAETFLRNLTKSDVAPVLFIICTTNAEDVKCFASIEEISYFRAEREVLFALGTVFKIEAINDTDRYTEIKMTVSEEYNEEIKKVIRELTAQVGESNALSTFGGFILDRGEYDNVERYCEKMVRQLPEGHPDRAEIYNNKGSIYVHRGEYDKALKSYLRANKLLHALPPRLVNDTVQAMTYCNIGIVYNKQQNFPEATSYYILAFHAYRQSPDGNQKELVRLCALISLAMSIHNPKYARYCVKKARALQEEFHLSTMHSSYAWLLLSDAILHPIRTMADQNLAIDKFQAAVKAFKDSLPEDHSEMVTVHRIVGDFYRSIRQYTRAETYYKQSYEICLKTHDEQRDHPELSICTERLNDIENLIKRSTEDNEDDDVD